MSRSLIISLVLLLLHTNSAARLASSGDDLTHHEVSITTIDLRSAEWGDGKTHALDGLWNSYWGQLLSPEQLADTPVSKTLFPVPGVWDAPSEGSSRLPAMGYMTYQVRVLVPDDLGHLNLYIPDMPSAYQLWGNRELLSANGKIGASPQSEQPGFLPKVVKISNHQGQLDLVIQLSNFHYREGGIWFSLRLTDDSGFFSMAYKPVIYAVFFAAILIAIGLYNLSLFIFRSKEVAALYFGFLCLVVGLRRLLIDERIVYIFDLFEWATLQRIEHLCFYLSLPLFIGFFASLYRTYVPALTIRLSWLLVSPFVLLCLLFPARLYTEFNIAFQLLVVSWVMWTCFIYIKALRDQGKQVMMFGLSLLVLALAVIHDVLKSNGFIDSSLNIAHFGVLAFVVSQSIALQRSYLNNLNLVEEMSSQLQSQNRALIEMDEFKDEFLATTSHELRTPLHGISGLAKVIVDSDQGELSTDQRSKIELIANTTQRLSVLVNDILDFSSIKHGKLKLNTACVDLHTLSELVLSTLKPMVADKQIALSARIDPGSRYVQVDEFRFQQILFNIMGNAVKYTQQGYIQLIAYPANGDLLIEISDSGVGIPSEKRQALFRPFEQVHVEGHLSSSGTGLGLSISRQLVELHGGTLEIDSEVGRGTTVRLCFPASIIVHHAPPENIKSPTTLHEAQSGVSDSIERPVPASGSVPVTGIESRTGPLIFVVDDEQVNRELVTSQLAEQGYQTETFVDGLTVLVRLNEQIPDLILLDYMMPNMTGLEVCQSIRSHYDSYELPVMMLTARHQISDIVEVLGAGANDYLIKPYHDKELIARVNSQLSVRKYWIANRENQKLKREITRREQLEEELSELNTRLLNVLDISAEMILLLNAQLQVVYANEKAAQTLSANRQGLLGLSISELVSSDVITALESTLEQTSQDAVTIQVSGRILSPTWQISIKRFEQKARVYLALVMLPVSDATDMMVDPAAVINDLTQELGKSRKRIDQIEGALKQLVSAPEPLNSEGKEDATPTMALPQAANDLANKEVIVSLHRTTLHFWERYTGQGKADLAERSRCWRVYLDGTTVKTRTYDKYLNVKSIPDRPRWRAVVRTANYVLATCDLSDDDRNELTRLSSEVEDLYS